MTNVNTSVKKYLMCKKDYSWNLWANVCENSKYLKSIVQFKSVFVYLKVSVIVCDDILNFADSVSVNVTNAISEYFTSIM